MSSRLPAMHSLKKHARPSHDSHNNQGNGHDDNVVHTAGSLRRELRGTHGPRRGDRRAAAAGNRGPLQGRAQQQHSRALAGALAGPAPCVMHMPGACAWAMRCPPPQATHSRWPAERRWRRWHAACIDADAAATRARGANSKYTSAICIYGTDYM